VPAVDRYVAVRHELAGLAARRRESEARQDVVQARLEHAPLEHAQQLVARHALAACRATKTRRNWRSRSP
jgi:hypothetical protein